MKRLTKHLSPATGIAFVALIFAVTGVSFAATGGGSSSPAHATLIATVAKSKPKAKAGPRGPAGPAGKKRGAGRDRPRGASRSNGAGGSAGARR